MQCRETTELLSALIDEALDTETAAAVRDHISQCTTCARELRMMQSVVRAAGKIGFIDPPRELAHRIISAIQAEQIEAQRCDQPAHLISTYVDGELAPEQAAALEAHAANCARCTTEIRALQGLREAVASVGFAEPPEGLKERIAAATTQKSASIWQTATRVLAARLLSRPAKICYAVALSGLLAFTLVRLPYQSTDVPPLPNTRESNKLPLPQTAASTASNEQQPQHTASLSASADKSNARQSNTGHQPARMFSVAKRYSDTPLSPSTTRSKTSVTGSNSYQPKVAPKYAAVEDNAAADSADDTLATSETKSVETNVATAVAEPSSSPSSSTDAKSGEVQVASAPLIDPQKIEEMIREIKAEAGMHRGSDQTVSISVLRSRF